MSIQFGHEGPPVQHRCRICREPVETFWLEGARGLVAKRHGYRYAESMDVFCGGSYGPVDPDAGLIAEEGLDKTPGV